MRIPGRWREGYALDFHVISSTFLGHDEFGHARFESKRSDIGELLYRLKYQSDQSVVPDLVEAATSFITSWKPAADTVVPVTPSRARAVQPVMIVGEAIAHRLGFEFARDWIKRTRDIPQLKNVYDYDERIHLLQGAYVAEKLKVEGLRILLFDDLYRSGATLNEMTATLYDQGGAAEVFALTLTRTRSGS
jgi:predicted amidophosphoribosyltransferase